MSNRIFVTYFLSLGIASITIFTIWASSFSGQVMKQYATVDTAPKISYDALVIRAENCPNAKIKHVILLADESKLGIFARSSQMNNTGLGQIHYYHAGDYKREMFTRHIKNPLYVTAQNCFKPGHFTVASADAVRLQTSLASNYLGENEPVFVVLH
jgi:hypothetical protein